MDIAAAFTTAPKKNSSTVLRIKIAVTRPHWKKLILGMDVSTIKDDFHGKVRERAQTFTSILHSVGPIRRT